MYAVAVLRLKTQRSTPTLLSLQDSLVPLLKAIPASAPPELAVDISRSLIKKVSHLAQAAWSWSQGTEDAGGEQKAVLTDIVQIAVMIFGPNVCADLTPRWFLATFPRFAGLHPEDGWQDGQASLDAAIVSCCAGDVFTNIRRLPASPSALTRLASLSASAAHPASVLSRRLLLSFFSPLHYHNFSKTKRRSILRARCWRTSCQSSASA